MLREVKYLIKKELLLEFRQRYAFAGLLLFGLSSVYVCYLSFENIENRATWNALLWIIVLFSAFNAIGKSFGSNTRGHDLYLYNLIRPEALILSKIIYNAAVMLSLSAFSMVFYLLFLGTTAIEQADMLQFSTGLLVGSIGLSATLTLVSAIAAKTNHSVGMMAVLGFPIIIPLLLVMMAFSEQALSGMPWVDNLRNLAFLSIIIAAVGTLSLVLFPYIWRD